MITEKILDDQGIQNTLEQLTQDVINHHKNIQQLVLVGIQTGGAFLAERIHRNIKNTLNVSIPIGSVNIALYRDDWTKISYQPILQGTNITFSVDDKDVLLIDDVIFTGRTVRAAMDALFDIGRPGQIELAVLVDRGHRELPVQPNYCGKVIQTKRSQTVNVYLKENDGQDAVELVS
ncbi:phosphoribosyl transferase [Candidatus Magnetomorum sp. HK-1]|nr:phosphoribosyl transferase [Candidatus Magnetomorum sp. HK-1]